MKVLDFQIEDPNNRNTFLNDGKIPIGEHYRFRISYKETTFGDTSMEVNDFHSIWNEDVSKIISIIQHQTEDVWWMKHIYETSDVFGDLEGDHMVNR